MPTDEQKQVIMCITIKLAQLGFETTFQEPITDGPIITTYRFMPRQSAKVAQICALSDDLALALAVEDVTIRRLPGEACIGISVPRKERKTVHWRDCLASPVDTNHIPLNLGVDVHGRLYRDDLTSLPHLLIAGATNSGKSTLMSSMIASLMYWRAPDKLQIYLSDTKQVEFGHFEHAPHIVQRVVTKYDTWKIMDELIQETERRLQVIARAHHKNILEFNKHTQSYQQLPYLILIIDELYDVLGGEERGEAKVANQKMQTIVARSRASGIHVIAGTQRSSVDVVSGSVKSNFPARISFRLPSEVDSRTILGQTGAEHLLAQGDMWYVSPNRPAMLRLHSAYASQDDIKACVAMVSQKEITR